MYARKLTKEELMKSGITNVTTDCHVFKGDEEIMPKTNNQGYFIHFIYDFDENGQKIFIENEKSAFGGTYKTRSIGLHRLMWAWFNDEVPEGLIVDHKNNSHSKVEDYYLSNLQLLTPSENVAKEKENWNVKEIKCQLNKPRSFYQEKLEGYLLAYEQAKKDHDAEAAHSLRTNVAQTKARLRYYDNHILEALELRRLQEEAEARKREYHERALRKKELKANVESARNMYKQLRDAYGKNDPIVEQYWGEWKLAIAMYYGFCAESKLEA